MKAVILDGVPQGNAEAEQFGSILHSELLRQGLNIETFVLRDLKVAPCQGCFGCWIRTPGECLIDDAGRTIARSVATSDLLVHFTPVTFGGYSSELKKAIDRVIPNLHPHFRLFHGELHHKQRYPHYPSQLTLGLLPGPAPEAEALFARLVERNALNFFPPAHATGVLYSGETEQEVREKLRSLLAKVGVGN